MISGNQSGILIRLLTQLVRWKRNLKSMTGARSGLKGRTEMNSNIESQNKMILDHMRTIGAITQDDADRLYACRRLPARIHDLRSKGHKVQTITTLGVNRFGRKIKYARYILMEA